MKDVRYFVTFDLRSPLSTSLIFDDTDLFDVFLN